MWSLLLTDTTDTTDWSSYLFIGFIVIILIAMFIIPSFTSGKKQKEAAEEKNFLRPGDKIKTVGGIVGIIVEVNQVNELDKELVVETGVEGKTSTMTFDINALYIIMERGEESLKALEEERLRKEAEAQAKLDAKKNKSSAPEQELDAPEVFEASADVVDAVSDVNEESKVIPSETNE